MKLVGLMHVRDEQWVLGASVPAALRLVDELVVIDHASTDRTPAILREMTRSHPGRITLGAFEGRHYHEAGMRQACLDLGRSIGGTHFFWIDADEIVTANALERVRSAMAGLTPGQGLELPWIAMWESLDYHRQDGSVWTNNFKRFGFADHPDLRFRAYSDGYDMHQPTPELSEFASLRPLVTQAEGGVMHLQFADRRRLIAKHAWYKMSETVRFPGRKSAGEVDATYNEAVTTRGLGRVRTPSHWWAGYAHLRASIDLDDAPWHEREVLRFWREHGPAAFEGLELWGLPERLESRAGIQPTAA